MELRHVEHEEKMSNLLLEKEILLAKTKNDVEIMRMKQERHLKKMRIYELKLNKLEANWTWFCILHLKLLTILCIEKCFCKKLRN